MPEGGGPAESWLPAGEGGDPGAGAGASPRAEQPWPKKPAGHGSQYMERRNESSPSTHSDVGTCGSMLTVLDAG